nr:hypothetical protein Iba_chr09cCG10180 [Ipomoea batatas]
MYHGNVWKKKSPERPCYPAPPGDKSSKEAKEFTDKDKLGANEKDIAGINLRGKLGASGKGFTRISLRGEEASKYGMVVNRGEMQIGISVDYAE